MTQSKDNGALRDEQIIRDITRGLDLNKKEDVLQIHRTLQTENITFVSDLGRDFDDRIFELYQEIRRGTFNENKSSSTIGDSKEKTKTKLRKGNLKTEKEKVQSIYNDKDIDELVKVELAKREKRRKYLIVIAAVVATLSLGYFGVYSYMMQKTNKQYEELAELKGSDLLSKSGVVTKKNTFILHKQEVVLPDILDEYKTLYAKNQKMVGWLKIDGTKIDYPVMQTEDNEYYLSHNFNQETDNNGSLFLDCGCDVFPQSTNMIIYGHHMKSGNMFGNLQKFAKESYWKDHPTISFDTIYEKGTYEVMYAFYSKVYDNDDLVFKYYQFINANSDAEFNYYMDEMKNLSLYDTGVTAKYGDTLLTLSTCDHSQQDGRFAVVAKKVR